MNSLQFRMREFHNIVTAMAVRSHGVSRPIKADCVEVATKFHAAITMFVKAHQLRTPQNLSIRRAALPRRIGTACDRKMVNSKPIICAPFTRCGD